jgi:hypothetical protein
MNSVTMLMTSHNTEGQELCASGNACRHGHGSFFPAGIYTQCCHWFPHLLASSEQACDQWHSSPVSTFLTGSHCKLCPNTEGPASKQGSKDVKHKQHQIKKAEEASQKRERAKKRTLNEKEFEGTVQLCLCVSFGLFVGPDRVCSWLEARMRAVSQHTSRVSLARPLTYRSYAAWGLTAEGTYVNGPRPKKRKKVKAKT